MGSLGSVLMFAVGGLLGGRFGYPGPFVLAGVLMVVAAPTA